MGSVHFKYTQLRSLGRVREGLGSVTSVIRDRYAASRIQEQYLRVHEQVNKKRAVEAVKAGEETVKVRDSLSEVDMEWDSKLDTFGETALGYAGKTSKEGTELQGKFHDEIQEIVQNLKTGRKQLIRLANKESGKLAEEAAEYRLEVQGKKKKLLSFNDLAVLFLRGDRAEFKEKTRLSDEEITKLHDGLAVYLANT